MIDAWLIDTDYRGDEVVIMEHFSYESGVELGGEMMCFVDEINNSCHPDYGSIMVF